MTKKQCGNCKHLSVIISQTSDYYCYHKHQNMNVMDFISDCKDFEADNVSLKEKEDKVWG